jgi:hypothetical protein
MKQPMETLNNRKLTVWVAATAFIAIALFICILLHVHYNNLHTETYLSGYIPISNNSTPP